MMLTHTSGLADFTDFPQLGEWVRHGVSEATVLTAVAQAPLQFQPGSQYSYSNSNFFALGTIIEKLTGRSYAANLDQYIFHPLGLTNTYYSLPPAGQSASGYTNKGAGLVPAILWDRSAAFAAGALSTNVYDLVAWHNGQIGGFTAETAVFLDSGFAVVVLTNDQDANPDAVILGIMNAVCNSSQLAGNC